MNEITGLIEYLRDRIATKVKSPGMSVDRAHKEMGVSYNTLAFFLRGLTFPRGRSLQKMGEWLEKQL